MAGAKNILLMLAVVCALGGACSRQPEPAGDIDPGPKPPQVARDPEPKVVPIRAYLMHITHYDPSWYARKDRERPFDLKLGCDMVEALGSAGFNMLIIDLADGVQYRSLPELKRPYSILMSDLETLVACARKQGLEVVPKLNFSKGKVSRHNDWFRPYNELPDTPEYWAKAFQLIDEIVGVCKPEHFFFIGMDEDTDRSDDQYVAAVTALHDGLAKRALRTVMWNDTAHVSAGMFGCIEKTLAAEDRTPKDIVHVFWDYVSVTPTASWRVADIAHKGFEFWVAPGGNPVDVSDWKQVVLQAGARGMVMTTWRPVREYGRKSLLDQIANLGPVYARPETVLPKPLPPLPASRPTRVIEAHMQSASVAATEPVLAPNYLGKPLEDVPYLLPSKVYLRNWMILGPFPFDRAAYPDSKYQRVIDDDSFVQGSAAHLVPQKDGTAAYNVTWRRFTPPADDRFPQVVNLHEVYDKMEYAVAYLVTQVHSDREVRDYSIYLGSDDFAKVWVNGQLVHTWADGTRGVTQDDDKIHGIALQKGWNTVVVKCVNLREHWGLMLRIADEKDRPLITSLEP